MIWKFYPSFARAQRADVFRPLARGGTSGVDAARDSTSRSPTAGDAAASAACAHGTPLYRGSCLCGSVRYEVRLDAKPEASVRSVWEQTVRPRHFKLLSGDETLSGHQFAGDQTQHFFCERCGVRSFSHHAANAAGAFYSVDLKSLERTTSHASATGAVNAALQLRGPRGPALC